MRKFVLAALACILVIAGGVTAVATIPHLNEQVLRLTCGEPTPRCLVRMRSLGHQWARHGAFDRAAAWYGRGAEAGDPIAMFHTAWAHEQVFWAGFKAMIRAHQGDTAPEDAVAAIMQDFDRAADWYRRAAERGFPPAMNNLGQLYLSGVVGRTDQREAFRWHLAAAQSGNPIAVMNVAIAYTAGQGVDPDPAAASAWSTWQPTHVNKADLVEPTLERTHLFRTTVPEARRALIRAAAKSGEPVRLAVTPLQPDPRLPTFREASGAVRQEAR